MSLTRALIAGSGRLLAQTRTINTTVDEYGNIKVGDVVPGKNNTWSQSNKFGHAHEKKEEVAIPERAVTVDSHNPNKLGHITGFTEREQHRRVKIFMNSKNVMQSGTNNLNIWRLKWDTQQRWENPCMGWSSTSDPLSNVHLEFDSAKQAAAFCAKNCWEYEIEEPKKPKRKPKTYANNFSWSSHLRSVSK